MKIFTVSGIQYLGVKEENTISGIQLNTALNENSFAEYFAAKHMEELITIEVGTNSDVISRDLTKRETLTFRSVNAEFDAAAEMSDKYLVVQVFEDLRKKR